MENIAIFGAGSYAQEVACMILKINNRSLLQPWNFVGYYDDNPSVHNRELLHGYVLGGIEMLNRVTEKLNLVVAIANTSAIKSVVQRIENENIKYPNLIDPDTSFTNEGFMNIGKGNIIGEGCRVGPFVQMGDFNIVVNDTVFGHDVKIGSFNVFFPAARLSGRVIVEDENVFGVRTTILPGLCVGTRNKFAPGCFLYVNAENNFIYQGNPARRMVTVK